MSTPNNTNHTDYEQQNEATTNSSNNKTAGGDGKVENSKNETSNFEKEEVTFDEKN